MISVNKALYLSAFSLFSLSFVKGQSKVPFGVVKAEEATPMCVFTRTTTEKL
ncbi:hypothetical protein BN1195_03807 [Chryseobacterium oranimense G311]|uniref:hypothetical protein n=1 Tax=Chryseobacterium oranimense TaxID=421058 RepID=UPI0005336E45|nr:hypothetical protein [Chryseobacterium oranimense]CEJ71458.1 hypothetical protein BN1195_03807 [Chryseobacterium oranimense G311]